MTTLTLNAPAKVNLFLEVSAKRPDGYHDIESVMQTVTLFDRITLSRGDRAGEHITVTCTEPSLNCDRSNLCFGAAERFFGYAGIKSYDLDVHIEKHIPVSAGLGGGSADSAAVIRGLNSLFETGFTVEELCRIGAQIGADVPFCIRGGMLMARGIGDVLSECGRLPDCFIVIACHGEGVSTPWAYGRLDEMYDFFARDTDIGGFIRALNEKKLDLVSAAMTNIFESAVLPEWEYPRMIIAKLRECGALRAMMSGSGPSVMGIFKDSASAAHAVRILDECGIAAHLCKPYYPDEE